MKGTPKTQCDKAIQDFYNQVLAEYNYEATPEISGRKQFLDLLKEEELREEKVCKDGAEE